MFGVVLAISTLLSVMNYVSNTHTVPLQGAGQDESSEKHFLGGLTTKNVINGIDGAEVLTASAATTTVTANQACSGRNILFGPAIVNASVTLPTVASLVSNCLFKAGYYLDLQFRNTSGTGAFVVSGGTGMTLYHIREAATTTAQGLSISSSTPAWFRIRIKLASGTDSTADVLETQYLTP